MANYKETSEGIELLPESDDQPTTNVKVEAPAPAPAQEASIPAPKPVNPNVFTSEKVTVASAAQPTAPPSVQADPGKTNIDVPDPIANMTARQMSEFFVGAYATYFPQLLYDHCKFSIPNVMFHTQQGHLPPMCIDLFTKINLETERNLQVQPMEKEFLIESIMPMVKIYKLNERPEISAALSVGMSIANKLKQASEYKKVNEQLLKNAMENYLKELDKRKEKEKTQPAIGSN